MYAITLVALTLAACAKRTGQLTPAVDELTCGDSSMPQAVYSRALRPTRADSLAGIAVITDDISHHRLTVADVQAWGPQGASGQPGDPTGLTMFTDRAPGLYSLRIRLEATSAPWMYAATLRPNYVDTATITVGTHCTVIWRGRGARQ